MAGGDWADYELAFSARSRVRLLERGVAFVGLGMHTLRAR